MLEVEPLTPWPGGYLVRFYDLRFAYPDVPGGRSLLSAWVQLDDRLKVVRENMGRFPAVRTERAAR
jgi:hypothetical protein